MNWTQRCVKFVTLFITNFNFLKKIFILVFIFQDHACTSTSSGAASAAPPNAFQVLIQAQVAQPQTHKRTAQKKLDEVKPALTKKKKKKDQRSKIKN